MVHNSLEYEYTQLKVSQTPDLWERIEPKLNEKQMSNHKEREIFNVRKAASIMGIMAACLLVFIAFPMILRDPKKPESIKSLEGSLTEEAAVENAVAGSTTDEERFSATSNGIPSEIVFLDKYYIWEEGTSLDIDPERLTRLGYIEAVDNGEDTDNSQIAGAVVYENTDSSIIIEWQEQFYLYRLNVE